MFDAIADGIDPGGRPQRENMRKSQHLLLRGRSVAQCGVHCAHELSVRQVRFVSPLRLQFTAIRVQAKRLAAMKLRVVIESNDGGPAGLGAQPEDTEQWQLVPAHVGSGAWLIARGKGGARVWAPPGVALTGEVNEPLERWTYAELAESAAPRPGKMRTWSLERVLDAVPADFHSWVLDATATQVRILKLYVRTASDDAHKSAAQVLGDEFSAELEARERRPPAGQQHVFTAGCYEPYAALTDHDFIRIVCQTFGAQLGRGLARWRQFENACPDVFVAEAEGTRHIVQVEHHLSAKVTDLVSYAVDHARGFGALRGDVHWIVTSHDLDTRRQGELARAVEPWVTANRHVIVDASALEHMLGRHPAVARDQMKRRAAHAAHKGRVPEPPDPALAETEALEVARRRLDESGAVVITGPRGSGKTTLMRTLVADAAYDEYLPLPASCGRSLGVAVRQGDEPMVVYVDGASDAEPMRTLVGAARAGLVRLVVTGTETLAEAFPEHTVDIGCYSAHDRAAVYYNHVWSADHLDPRALAALAAPDAYQRVIEQPGFTPRMAQEVVAVGPAALSCLPIPSPRPPEADEQMQCLFGRIRQRAIAGICE